MRRYTTDDPGESPFQRTRACHLAPTDWKRALDIAREIVHPWYRVQSLAAVAEHAPDERVDELLKRALSDADMGADEYKRAAVRTWIIRAARARGRSALASRVVREVLHSAPSIEPIASRCSALDLILREAALMSEAEARAVATALLDGAMLLIANPYSRWRKRGKSYTGDVAIGLCPRYS